MKWSPLTVVILGLFSLAADTSNCENDKSDRREHDDVERQQDVYTKTQKPPFFDWSFERHLMIKLYEARNRAVATHSYVVSHYTGKIIWSCPSLGYPIPATTQLTNPLKTVFEHPGLTTVQQAEPNGLYSPSYTTATWVMCLGPDGNVEPAYVEDNVMAFPRPMKAVDGALVPVENQTASVSISPKRPN